MCWEASGQVQHGDFLKHDNIQTLKSVDIFLETIYSGEEGSCAAVDKPAGKQPLCSAARDGGSREEARGGGEEAGGALPGGGDLDQHQ